MLSFLITSLTVDATVRYPSDKKVSIRLCVSQEVCNPLIIVVLHTPSKVRSVNISVWEGGRAHAYRTNPHPRPKPSLSRGPRRAQLACASTGNRCVALRCVAWCMRSPTRKKGFLRVCCRHVTEPVLLSDDQLFACLFSAPTVRLPLHLARRSYLIIAPSALDSALLSTHQTLPLSNAEEAK